MLKTKLAELYVKKNITIFYSKDQILYFTNLWQWNLQDLLQLWSEYCYDGYKYASLSEVLLIILNRCNCLNPQESKPFKIEAFKLELLLFEALKILLQHILCEAWKTEMRAF